MKPIDLLVQELPKRGGWPEGYDSMSTNKHGWVSAYKNNGCLSLFELCIYSSEQGAVTREQYEAELAASQKVEWDGDGLPPVGVEVEYTLNGRAWKPCRVEMYVGTQGCVMSCDVFEFIQYVHFIDYTDLKFRPIRSESDKKRDAAIEWFVSIMPTDEMTETAAGYLYDAIAAGKIHGVKLED